MLTRNEYIAEVVATVVAVYLAGRAFLLGCGVALGLLLAVYLSRQGHHDT